MDEQNIPIDISVRKLLDWLISRHICNRDWHDKVVSIREKIGKAMEDMPENDAMKELLTGTHINYFVSLKIVEILKETEADSKNFLGMYGSQRMKDWRDIVSQYEGGNVYLAEAAQLLTQNVTYELPGLKKHVAKCEQVQTECDKKERDNDKRMLELQQEYRKECAQLGIVGDKLKKEIIDLAKNLPVTYEEIAEKAKHLQGACDLYKEFLRDTLEKETVDKVIENLTFLVQNGNATTYQWKYGEMPITVEEPRIEFGEEGDEDDQGTEHGADSNEIDFGDGGDQIDFGDIGDGEIDFGDDVEGEIDWGNIDNGEEVIDFGVIDDVDTSAIVVEEGGIEGGVARDDEALSILDNRRTRALLLDELMELECFLQQRLVEITSDNIKLSLGTSSRQNQDANTIESMLSNIREMIDRLREHKMQQLQMIRGSPAYADRLADSLRQKLRLVEKVEAATARVKTKRSDAAAEQAKAREQLENILTKTEELQGQICGDVSKRFKGRKVHLMGM